MERAAKKSRSEKDDGVLNTRKAVRYASGGKGSAALAGPERGSKAGKFKSKKGKR